MHIRYATKTGANTMGSNSGWMEYPRGVAEALGGSYSGYTWFAPALANNLVFILGTSSRISDYAIEQNYGTTGLGGLGNDLYTNRYHSGPRLPQSSTTPAVVISVEVDNL